MLLALPASLLALALLTAPPSATEASLLAECEAASPHFELEAVPSVRARVVCVSPHLPTTFQFNFPLASESVDIQERERFEDVSVGSRSFTVVPPKDMVPGEGFRVVVRFADGAAPASAVFLLVAHPALSPRQVEVFRRPRPEASFQQETAAAKAETQQCREEVRQLRAERTAPDGLRGVLASGLVGDEGIPAQDLYGSVTEHQGNALSVYGISSSRAVGRVAVDVRLRNPGTRPWTAAGAALRGARGEVLKLLPLWQPEPILPGPEAGRVVVEAEAKVNEARGPYTLTLWDADQTRTVTLGNVMFP